MSKRREWRAGDGKNIACWHYGPVVTALQAMKVNESVNMSAFIRQAVMEKLIMQGRLKLSDFEGEENE